MWASYLQNIEYLNKAVFDIKLDSEQTNNMSEGSRAGRAGVIHHT